MKSYKIWWMCKKLSCQNMKIVLIPSQYEPVIVWRVVENSKAKDIYNFA